MDRTNVLGIQNYQKINDDTSLLRCQKEYWSAFLVNPLPFHTAPMTDYNRSFPNNKNVGLPLVSGFLRILAGVSSTALGMMRYQM